MLDMNNLWARIGEQTAKRQALVAQASPFNKAAIFAALKAAGLSRAVVTFDGSGDSGQLEDSWAEIGEINEDTRWNNEGRADIPDVKVTIKVHNGKYEAEDMALVEKETTLQEALQDMAWEIIEAHHGGWENNEGAYGELTFEVETDAIDYTHNTRIESVETDTYQL